MKRAVVAGVAAAALLAIAPARAASPVDTLLGSCPAAAEIAQLRADLSISFETTLGAGTPVCSAASGSADLTRLQERTFQALRAMKRMTFARPLPWTSQSLYDWLVGAIDGLRWRDDIAFSFCCDPANTIDLGARPDLTVFFTNQWREPQFGIGLAQLVGLLVHEARHNQGLPHTCGSDDQTVDELGAWGVQYYLNLWEGLYGGAFFRDPAASRSNRELAIEDAESLLGRFCTITTADVSLTAAIPASVAIGDLLELTFTVANAGPQSAPRVYFATDLPAEVRVLAASPRATCFVRSDAPEVACELGRLDPGSSTTVTLAVGARRLPGETIALGPGALVPRVTATARDPRTTDNQASFSVAVTQNPRCPGVPGSGGIIELGTSVGDHLLGTPRRDLLCSLGGADIITGLGGSDVLRGGAGSDRIEARDRVRDSVSCGPGRDTVLADRVDAVARDCERVSRR